MVIIFQVADIDSLAWHLQSTDSFSLSVVSFNIFNILFPPSFSVSLSSLSDSHLLIPDRRIPKGSGREIVIETRIDITMKTTV